MTFNFYDINWVQIFKLKYDQIIDIVNDCYVGICFQKINFDIKDFLTSTGGCRDHDFENLCSI